MNIESQRFNQEAAQRDREARILRNYDRSRATPNGLSISLAAISQIRMPRDTINQDPYPCGQIKHRATWVRGWAEKAANAWRLW